MVKFAVHRNMEGKAVYIGLGSNMGNRRINLQNAVTRIEEQLNTRIILSSLYETEPWGMEDQEMFLNQVGKFHTLLNPEILLKKLLAIELELGRKRMEKWGPRIIDLDLLMYSELIISTDFLKIPHPELHLRKFVLVPLCELDSNRIHPELGISMQELLKKCPDTTIVKKYDG